MSLSACWRGRRTYILLRYKCSPIIDSQLNRHQSEMRGKMKENPNPRGEVISWKTTFCVGHEISISFGDFFKMVPPQETQIPLWMRHWNTGKVIADFVNSPCLKLRKNLRQEFRCPSQRLSDSSMLKPSAVCPDNGWVFLYVHISVSNGCRAHDYERFATPSSLFMCVIKSPWTHWGRWKKMQRISLLIVAFLAPGCSLPIKHT